MALRLLLLLALAACSGEGGGLSANHSFQLRLHPGQAAECEAGPPTQGALP